MQRLAALAAAFLAASQFVLFLSPDALFAQEPGGARSPFAIDQAGAASRHGGTRTLLRESWVEEWDPSTGRWVRVSAVRSSAVQGARGARADSTRARFDFEQRQPLAVRAAAASAMSGSSSEREALAVYGPFRVADPRRAVLVGSTDASTPALFDAMLRDFPALEVIEMVDAPGTDHDIANLALGRRIREAGLSTHVPRGGSVRSGAVELFLAGRERTIEPGARFAVHSWLDTHGREADDFAPDAPAHRMYIGYYMEMGLSEARAREFYAMTNSVPHSSALWLGSDEMRSWIAPAPRRAGAARMAALAAPVSFAEGPLAPPTLALEQGPQDFAAAALAPAGMAMPSIDYADLTHATLAWHDTRLLDTQLDSRGAIS